MAQIKKMKRYATRHIALSRMGDGLDIRDEEAVFWEDLETGRI